MTSQTENTKYKWPPYATDKKTLQLKYSAYATASIVVSLDILFMLKVKLGTFLPIHRVVYFDLISNIFVLLCK